MDGEVKFALYLMLQADCGTRPARSPLALGECDLERVRVATGHMRRQLDVQSVRLDGPRQRVLRTE